MPDKSNTNEDDIIYVSKTQLKQDMHELQELGERLLAMKLRDLERLPLTSRFFEAYEEAKRITKREARRRHLQYVGKVMRDEDVEAIEQKLAFFDPATLAAFCERWRDLIINNADELQNFLTQYPLADRQQYRTLQRNAAKEKQANDALIAEGGKQAKTPAAKKLLSSLRAVIIDSEQ